MANHPDLTRVVGRSPQENLNDAATIRADADRVAKFL